MVNTLGAADAEAVAYDHFVVSEHEGPEGRYYRQSPMMGLDYCRERARRMVEEEGAISATIGKAILRVERRFQSVEMDPVWHAGSLMSAGSVRAKVSATSGSY